MKLSLVVTAVALLLLTACGSEAPRTPSVAATQPTLHIDAATAGTIAGRILFKGKPPAMPAIDMSSNPQCERQHPTPQMAETVVVNGNGTLRNVFVWIKDGLAPGQWQAPKESARFDQNGCVYQPHVLGIMEAQQLDIENHDPVNHNVHAECQVNQPWNESQAPRAEHKFKTFTSPEALFPVTCSVHPWMRAYIAVSPHPFFAVTGADGAFELRGVPPGAYTIEAVHEKYGKKEGRLTLAPSGAATIEFTYGS